MLIYGASRSFIEIVLVVVIFLCVYRELAEDGYSGVEVRVTPAKTEIIIMATRTQNVLGEKGRR